MLFSYNKNVNLPDTSVGNNKINEISVTNFLGIHLDKKINFGNHITKRPNQKNIYGVALALIAIMYGIMQGIIAVASLLSTMH